MKRVLFSFVALSFAATTLISCQSNQKGTEDSSDSTAVAVTDTATDTTAKATKIESDILNVSPTVKVKAPEFSNEDVNNGLAKFEPLKEEYMAALDAQDAGKIKEVTAKYYAWVKDASTWGSKLPKEENQIYIDHYTKLVTQWDKLTLKIKK